MYNYFLLYLLFTMLKLVYARKRAPAKSLCTFNTSVTPNQPHSLTPSLTHPATTTAVILPPTPSMMSSLLLFVSHFLFFILLRYSFPISLFLSPFYFPHPLTLHISFQTLFHLHYWIVLYFLFASNNVPFYKRVSSVGLKAHTVLAHARTF